MMSVTSFPISTIVTWPFDDNLFGLISVYTGTYTRPSSISFVTGNVGKAIEFYESEYVQSMTQFMNLSYQSWTIETYVCHSLFQNIIVSLSPLDGFG